jgi:hypothetical protein
MNKVTSTPCHELMWSHQIRTMNKRGHINVATPRQRIALFYEDFSINVITVAQRRESPPQRQRPRIEPRNACARQANLSTNYTRHTPTYLAQSLPYMSIMIFYISGSRDSARRTRNRRESKDGSTSLTCTSAVSIQRDIICFTSMAGVC